MKKIIPADSSLIPDKAKLVFEGVVFSVFQWPQELYDGNSATFEMLRRADTVKAICVTDDGILVLEDEQPNRMSKLVFPGGRVDPTDTSTLEAIRREVQEETGYTFNNWRLVSVQQRFGKIEWFIHVYIAWDGQKVSEPHLDAGERIIVRTLPFNEVRELAIKRVGYLADAVEVFEEVDSVGKMLALPEFVGLEVDR